MAEIANLRGYETGTQHRAPAPASPSAITASSGASILVLASDDGERLLLFDPIAVPEQIPAPVVGEWPERRSA